MKILLFVFILFSKFVNSEIIDIENIELNNLIEKKLRLWILELKMSGRLMV